MGNSHGKRVVMHYQRHEPTEEELRHKWIALAGHISDDTSKWTFTEGALDWVHVPEEVKEKMRKDVREYMYEKRLSKDKTQYIFGYEYYRIAPLYRTYHTLAGGNISVLYTEAFDEVIKEITRRPFLLESDYRNNCLFLKFIRGKDELYNENPAVVETALAEKEVQVQVQSQALSDILVLPKEGRRTNTILVVDITLSVNT